MNQKQFGKPTVFRFKRFSHKAYSAFNSMHKVVNIGVVAGCVLAFAHAAETSAQLGLNSHESEKITEKELDEVTVTASRIELSVNQAAKQVTVITRKEIEQVPVQSIQDLLNYVSGIDVQQRGGHGVQADISIRGGSFDQTAILLNGVNLSNPQTGHYSFDIPINLSDIERIEIIYGPASLIYGASAFSGGINIITRKDPDHKAYARVEVGSYNLLNAEARGVVKNDAVATQLSAGYVTSSGYINNSDYDIINLLSQTRFNIQKSKIDLQLGFNDKQYGANTFYSAAYPSQYEKVNSYLASVKGEMGDKLKFIPIVYWNRHNDCFQLIKGDESKIPFNYHKTDVYGSNLNLQYTSQIGITSFGAEFRNEGIMSTVLGKALDELNGKFTHSDNRTNISYILEHNVLLDRFTFSAGILANYTTYLKRDYKFYPALNGSFRILHNFKVYTSWNKATRMPTFTDLYYTTVTHTGNSVLKPEDSESFDLGFKYNTPLVKAYITGYLMKGKNMIDWIWNDSQDKWESSNISKINKQGVDMAATFFLKELLPFLDPTARLDIGYSRLYQKHNSGELTSSYRLNYLRDKFTAQLNHPIYKGISANWNFRWQKRMGTYLKYENLKPATHEPYSHFSTLDLRINWKLKDCMFTASVNNIFDKKYFDLGNVPQAGFWLMAGVSYTLR